MSIAWDGVEAIREYMNKQEGPLRASKAGTKLINDFRAWYMSKNIVDQTVSAEKALSEAKWYRNEANRMLGMPTLENPVDVEGATGVNAPAASKDPTPPSVLIPTWVKVTGGIILGLAVWSFFSSLGSSVGDND